jgi:phosphoribosylaminoimidazolecarboxamide formyltransferase / IMP cyclohydrolase
MIRDVKKVQDRIPVKHAFITLFNKTQSEQLVEGLFETCPGIIIFSSGGTYSYLKKYFAGKKEESQLVDVSSYTGMPETDGGLVKTLHHKMFLGYLTETFSELHQADLEREKAVPIDLVIVDLYPFSEVVSNPESTVEQCRGNIDVGGPSALRAAAKNFLRVMVVPKYSPDAYTSLITQLRILDGCTNIIARLDGFKETFKVLAEYDSQVAKFTESIYLADIKRVYEIIKE